MMVMSILEDPDLTTHLVARVIVNIIILILIARHCTAWLNSYRTGLIIPTRIPPIKCNG